MMKKILYIVLATLLAAYVIVAAYFSGRREYAYPPCREVEVIIADSLEKHFLKAGDIVARLKRTHLYPLNGNGDGINTHRIKNELLENEIIETADVTRTLSGKIKIVVSQKMPILRVFTSGGSYYVDKSGHIMPSALGQAIYVPVASGNIDKTFATAGLYKFALFLQKDDFWNNQIEQIYVRSADDVELVPRAGSHRILIGSLDNYENKLERLRLFYEQVIPKMGWGKYSVVNLKYRNQIVCTKSKKTEP
ncbi:MAG: cell division protein FtsQ [Tannerella sp.]|jgi:cell division protein FtsQ|nr:cell division protein FtsQ [Tannerella sp.]